MSSGKKELIRELRHQINSPLAAIRNALYLTAARVGDPEVERYLKLADEEASRIAAVLSRAEQLNENKGFRLLAWRAEAGGSAA